ncbi:hypothetical protein BJY01DRAFT_251401 [Aspergillus pseudoustus]|uniref:Transcription factor domain-containing protein n=1 Tax=Aspergillus pseudoustus TaxID=1810923 RepID=A0ABR4JBZ5_9EURO
MPCIEDHCQHRTDMTGAIAHYKSTVPESLYTALPDDKAYPDGAAKDTTTDKASVWVQRDNTNPAFPRSPRNFLPSPESSLSVPAWLGHIPSNLSHRPSPSNSSTVFSTPLPPPAPPTSHPGEEGNPYPCLEPLLPHLKGIITGRDAARMLEIYFSVWKSSTAPSAYAPAHVLHSGAVLHPVYPRPTSLILLLVILLSVSQTADLRVFDPPGARQRVTLDLYYLVLNLMEPMNLDDYLGSTASHGLAQEGLESTDLILALVIMTLVVSRGHSKPDGMQWWAKATRLIRSSGLNMEDKHLVVDSPPSSPSLGHGDMINRARVVAKEERRRLFWLVYYLDRHIALSFNSSLHFPGGTFHVAVPLPEALWQTLEHVDLSTVSFPAPCLGPPRSITGFGFFECFLPLASLLGHIIELHRFRINPLLGKCLASSAFDKIEALLLQRQQEVAALQQALDATAQDPLAAIWPGATTKDAPEQAKIALAYTSCLLEVLYLPLHGKWDPLPMMDDDKYGRAAAAPGSSLQTCVSHAISSAAWIRRILDLDPELTYMPYIFSIYLVHTSFMILGLMSRMLETGSGPAVEESCEVLIRAHEVSIMTLDCSIQKNVRKALRSMLHRRRYPEQDTFSYGKHRARWREMLSAYRWTPAANGMAGDSM